MHNGIIGISALVVDNIALTNIGQQNCFCNEKKRFCYYHSRGIKISKIESDRRPIIFSGSHFACKKKKYFVKKSNIKNTLFKIANQPLEKQPYQFFLG